MSEPELRALIASIAPVDNDAARAAADRHQRLAKPAGSLGQLESLGAQLAAIHGACPPPVPARPVAIIAAGDHGVHRHGVSPWPQETTALMVGNFDTGKATANAFAAVTGVEVSIIDAGVATAIPGSPDLVRVDAPRPTGDIRTEPAMSTATATAAILTGAARTLALIDDGADLIMAGDMGIANTTPSAALIAAFTGNSAKSVTGRGTGIDGPTLKGKIEVVEDALERHGAEREPLATLASLGGLEHAAIVGIALAAASRRRPFLIDGVNTAAAALTAVALAPDASGYLIAAHRSVEPGASAALRHLRKEPLIDLGLRLGEGTGAILAVPLVQAAARVLHDVITLDEMGLG